MAHVFHIARRAEWEAADLDGAGYAPAAFGSEGFVHCSTRPQVLPTAARHFATDADELVLVVLDEDRLGESLRHEAVPSVGETFPHLHRRIRRADVVGVAAFPRGEDGRHTFPQQLAAFG